MKRKVSVVLLGVVMFLVTFAPQVVVSVTQDTLIFDLNDEFEEVQVVTDAPKEQSLFFLD
ncbi:hypothetical protein [Vagococcus hydrophili]|uniref:Uncharacterized protein n=1 Tax=Vagococcus hydrophili TaxID=2714947 RepID=A0A6G8AR66_9ENTE|nr:hypothetical protein [Vagococcus hydrophili]QIL47480.1 hypothetical protein G7082_02485 [Vagococcus hydrophili]